MTKDKILSYWIIEVWDEYSGAWCKDCERILDYDSASYYFTRVRCDYPDSEFRLVHHTIEITY